MSCASSGRVFSNADGAIDRKRLAAEVFGKPERLAALNRLVHPHVFRRERGADRRVCESRIPMASRWSKLRY